MRLDVRDYVLEIDAFQTRRKYRELEQGPFEGCTCGNCQNYLAAIDRGFLRDVLTFLRNAGVDMKQLYCEVAQYGEAGPSTYLYIGGYYLCGELLATPLRDPDPFGAIRADHSFRFGLSTAKLTDEALFFGEKALVFKFRAFLPWVIGEKEWIPLSPTVLEKCRDFLAGELPSGDFCRQYFDWFNYDRHPASLSAGELSACEELLSMVFKYCRLSDSKYQFVDVDEELLVAAVKMFLDRIRFASTK